MADKVLQNKRTFEHLLSKVKCGNFEFVLRERSNGDCTLQIQFDAVDNTQPQILGIPRYERQFCRIWPLQDTMCDSEVIRTAWKAAKAAVMHELEEHFTFMDEMIYGPHTNVYALVNMRKQGGIDDVRVPEDGDEPSRFGSKM